MHEDITLIFVPFTLIDLPPLGIAVLKGAIESQGFRVKTIDLGMDLFKSCHRDRDRFESLQEYFISPAFKGHQQDKDFINTFLDKWATSLAQNHAKFLGFSVFSEYSHLATYLLCEKIKKIAPDKKIVIGGPGVSVSVNENMKEKYRINQLDQNVSYGMLLHKRKLVDYYILGDGEQALIDLLKGADVMPDQFQAINYQRIELPFANFDDYNLQDYEGNLGRGYPQIPIFSSKGCVRACDFCDVDAVTTNFRFRTGANIVKEMIHLADKHNIRDFVFLDSLVNGSLKSFLDWITELAKYNDQNPDKKITWSGQWICRPIGQIKEEVYEIMARSGCQSLAIGTESGSNSVLEAMIKKTNVEAFYYEAQQFRKYNIKFISQMIIGHWSETWEDFLQTCDMMYRLCDYVKTGHYNAVGVGMTFAIKKDTPAYQNRDVNKIESVASHVWWTSVNPDLTGKERYMRLVLFDKLVRRLNMPVMMPTIPGTFELVKSSQSIMQDFYKEKTQGIENLPAHFAEYYYDNFEQFLQLLHNRNTEFFNQLNIEIKITADTSNQDLPELEISVDQQTLACQKFDVGVHDLSFNISAKPQGSSVLKICFRNKKPNDTIVDEQGQVIKDKYIQLDSLKINGIDLMKDEEFFYGATVYRVDNVATQTAPGFWFNNSELEIKFDQPFNIWYSLHSNKNKEFPVEITTGQSVPKRKIRMTYEQYRDGLVGMLKELTY
jgi:hypothetical protein